MPVTVYGPNTDLTQFTPEQLRRLRAERQKLMASRGRASQLMKIASGAGQPDLIDIGPDNLPGLNDDPAFLRVAKNLGTGVVDLLGRGNFAAAGLADELLVKRTGPIAALGRVAREIFSGVGPIQGEKQTFRDILDAFDIASERQLRDSVSSVDNIPLVGGLVGSFNLRGTLGLALDIALDPLTYLTGGGSALAKVPTRFRGAVLGGTARLIGETDSAIAAFTRKGVKARQAAEKAAAEEIKRAPHLVGELSAEAHRQAIEEVQDRLHAGLIEIGVSAGRAGDLAHRIVPEVGKILKGEDAGAEALLKTLKQMNSKTAAKVRTVLGLGKKGRREAIGESISARIAKRADDMLRTGIDQTGELSQLAADIAYRRSVDSVLEIAKEGGEGLVRDVTPLRWFGKNIGPVGKSLTEWVVQSEISSKMVGALKKAMPTQAINAGVVATRFMRDKIDVVGRMLNESWDARKLRGYHILRRAHLDATAAAIAKNANILRQTKLAEWYDGILRTVKDPAERDGIFRKFAIALDSGDFSALAPAELEAAQDFRRIMNETVAVDVRKGLMKADNVRTNYFPHFIDHPERILNKLIAANPGRTVKTQATIGRFAEVRTFDNITDIERAAAALGVDPKINFDPMHAIRARTQATVEGSLYQDFYRSVVQEFGKEATPLDPNVLFKMGQPLVDPATQGFKVAERLAQGNFRPDAAQLLRLQEDYGREAVGEFLRQRMLRLTGMKSITRFMAKYEGFMDALPRLTRVEDLAPDGSRFVQMPHQFGKAFAGKMIPESAAESIRRMRVQTARAPELDEFLGFFDSFNNGLKVALTALFPAFHFRNFYSNVAQNFLDIGIAALNPVKALRAARLYNMVYDGSKVLERTPLKWLGPNADAVAWREVGGRTVTLQEAALEIRRNNIVRNHDEIFEATTRVQGRIPKGATPVEGFSRTKKGLTAYSRAGKEVGGWVENEGRIALYSELRSRGLSEAEATARTNKLLFDYQALTEFERVYLKRAIPFYVWTKKNIALQAEALRNMPGRQAALVKPFRDDHESEIPLLDYEVGQFRIVLDQNGQDVRMLTGIDLPIMSIDRLLPIGKLVRGEFGEAYKSVAAQMNPLLRVPQELAANETFFDQRRLDRQTSQSIGRLLDPEGSTGKLIPKSVRQWLDFQKTEHLQSGKVSYSFNGPKFYTLFRTWHLSRFVSSSDAWFNRALQDTPTAANFAALLTSLRDVRVNMDEKRRRVLDERLDKLQDALVKKGLAGRFERIFPLREQAGRYRQVR